jgi:YHS domain-containing protein
MHSGGIMAVDPVCGMKVDEDNAEFQSAYGGKDVFTFAPKSAKPN